MGADGIRAWRQRLGRPLSPDRFRGNLWIEDPTTDLAIAGAAFATWVISDYAESAGMSSEDRKYLRVSYEVMGRWPKQDRKFEKRQLEELAGHDVVHEMLGPDVNEVDLSENFLRDHTFYLVASRRIFL